MVYYSETDLNKIKTEKIVKSDETLKYTDKQKIVILQNYEIKKYTKNSYNSKEMQEQYTEE